MRVFLDRLVTYLTAIIKCVTYYTCICSFQINYIIISMIHHFLNTMPLAKLKSIFMQTTALAKTKTALCSGNAQPSGGGWNVLFDVNKAARLALRTLHTALCSDRSLATAIRCSSAALIAWTR